MLWVTDAEREKILDGLSVQHILTDEEREAVEYFAAFDRSPRERDAAAAATLRGLLARLSPPAT
jgi:hypothetical protein